MVLHHCLAAVLSLAGSGVRTVWYLRGAALALSVVELCGIRTPRAIHRANLDARRLVHNERPPPARLASRILGPHAGVCAGVCARVNLPLLLLLLSRPVAEIVLLDRRLVVTLGVVQPRAIGRTKKEHKIVLLCLQILCLPIQVARCTDVARHVRPAEMSAAPSALSDRSTHQPTGNTACLMIQHARNGGSERYFLQRLFAARGLKYKTTKRFFGTVFIGPAGEPASLPLRDAQVGEPCRWGHCALGQRRPAHMPNLPEAVQLKGLPHPRPPCGPRRGPDRREPRCAAAGGGGRGRRRGRSGGRSGNARHERPLRLGG